MSVRFQFAGDKDISVGRAGGASLFKLPGAISFPAAGSYNSTLYSVTYPIAEGGASVTVLSVNYPSQNCDVDVLNDGSGGTYTDWSTAINQAYKPFGEGLYYDPTPQPVDFEVPSGSNNYYTGGTQGTNYYHDGSGSSYNEGVILSYYSQDTDTNIAVLDVNQQSEIPSGSGLYYNNGLFNGYTWNGSGGYNYPVTKGAYYTAGDNAGLSGLDVTEQTEVPTGGSLYNTGRTIVYTWDGSGGYNYPVYNGDYHANGTLVWESVSSTSNAVDVNGNYYDSTINGDQYLWDGSGGYTHNTSWYYPYGTFIYSDGTDDYKWDGSGSYYSTPV